MVLNIRAFSAKTISLETYEIKPSNQKSKIIKDK